MPTYREEIRDAQAERYARAVEKQIDVEDLRKEDRTTQGMGQQVDTFINESVPRRGNRQRSVLENPPLGAIDSANVDFTLANAVLFNDLQVVAVISGVANRLDRTSDPAPAGGRFYFDGVSLLRLGDVLDPGDGLFVFYNTRR